MDLHQHATVSGACAMGIGFGTGDWHGATAFFVLGVFIDLDHLADYWREDGFNLNWRRFLGFFDARLPKRQWLFLHGWEWVAVALGLSFALGAPAWMLWGALGWLGHLILDHLSNGLRPWAYFFIYRVKVGFASKKLYV